MNADERRSAFIRVHLRLKFRSRNMPTEFRNEPFTDFTKEENAQAMRDAIKKVQSELGREYPLVIGGERVTTGDLLECINPANRTQGVGGFNKATKELATREAAKAPTRFST